MNKLNSLSKLSTVESTYARSPDVLVIARALWAGKWRMTGMIALALGLAAAYIATTEPIYTARTILSLEDPGKTVMESDSAPDGPAAEEKKLETETEVLQSRRLVEKLVRELSLLRDPEFNPMLRPDEFPSLGWALDRLRQLAGSEPPPPPDARTILLATIDQTLAAISVNSVPDTYLIEVWVQTKSPEKSARIANTLASLYIVGRRQADLDANKERIEWLTSRVGELKDALELGERELRDFNASAEVTSPEALNSQGDQLKALRERYLNSREKIKLAETRMALLGTLLENPASQAVAAVAADRVLSEALWFPGTASASPKVDEGAVRQLLARVESERDREKRLAETTASAITDLEARVERQSDEMVHLRQLEREVQANTAIYEFALNRLKQLSVERGIERAGARILSAAEPPLGPTGPGSAVVAALAVVLGALLGAGVTLVRQGVQDSFRTADDIERLSGIQVLGQVLELPTHRRRRVMKHIMSQDPNPFSDSIRNLRASVLSNAGTQRIVIALTSAMPGEGKTTLALALARSMSAIGKDVLVIDADLRRRALGRHFPGRNRAAGLVSAIVDRKPLSELVTASEGLEADVLLSEASSYNPADLFSLPDFRRLLGEARRKYHVTIIDTPPSLLVSDARLIAPHADMLLLAVRWNRTTKWQLTDAIRELQLANCVVTGCVLSRMDPKGMTKYGYGDRRGLIAGYRSGYYG